MDDLGPAIANSKITSLNVAGNNLNLNRGIKHITDILANGALTSLNLSNNKLVDRWSFSSDQWWLNDNYPPGHSDGNPCKAKPDGADDAAMAGVIALADGIKNNGALETITFGDKQAVTMKSNMTEADLSGKELAASGAIIVAAFLTKCQ